MASSTTLQLGKSSWPSQILLMCRLGKGSANCQLQTTPPTVLDIWWNTPTHYVLYCSIAFRSRALADILEVRSLGRWICMVLEWIRPLKRLAYSRIAAASIYIAWETQKPPDIFQHHSTGYLYRTREVYETCACVIHTNLQLHNSITIIPPYETLHDRPLRASEPHLTFSYWVPEHQARDRILHDV